MATGFALDFSKYVLYICHCNQLVTIDSMYFCRHCKLLRCMDCVTIQIDGTCISCPSCSDSIPQADAKAKKYRCGHCYQCPMCSTPLATRFVQRHALSDKTSDGGDSEPPAPSRLIKETSPKRGSDPSPVVTPPKTGLRPSQRGASVSSLKSPGGTKLYYLICTHCHWTTREVSTSDKRSLLDFKELPHPFSDRYKALLSYYKDFDLYERAAQQIIRRQQAGRKVRSPFSSLLDTSKLKLDVRDRSPKQVESISQIGSEPQPIPDSFYTDSVDTTLLCSLDQMTLDPSRQPVGIKQLWPRPLPLISRKTVRCRGCDHILLKPDVNVNLVRFKIQHVAIQVLPRIRLLHMPNLTLGQPSIVALSLTSPVNYNMTLSFQQYSDTRKLKESLCPVALPEGSFTLRCIDDISDILDESDSSPVTKTTPTNIENDFVLSSEPGRLILKFVVIPSSDEIDAKIVFMIRFTYEPLIEADREPGGLELTVPVLVNCGHEFI